MNLSSFSWKPPGEVGLPSEKEGKDAVTNREDSYDKDEKVNNSSFACSCCLHEAECLGQFRGLEAGIGQQNRP